MNTTPGGTPSPTSKKKFTATAALIQAAECLLLAMAYEGTIRPTVEQYEAEILAKHRFPADPKWREHAVAEPILDRKRTYLLSQADAATFHKACFAARDEARLEVSDPQNCPLLEAETIRIQAQNTFIAELGAIPGLESLAKHPVLTLEQRAKLLDLGLRLVAPFVRSAECVVQGMVATPPTTLRS